MNEYQETKKRLKDSQNLWYIFVPVWFVSSIIAMNLGDLFQDSMPILSWIFRALPLLAFPVWIFVVFQFGGFRGPIHLKCQKCGHPAFETNMSIDWKFEGVTRDFKDICPNCGNDNRIDLHDT